jgi:hypothetical protein
VKISRKLFWSPLSLTLLFIRAYAFFSIGETILCQTQAYVE